MTPTREQVELAAKAAGLTVLDEYAEGPGIMVRSPIYGREYWNPTSYKPDSFDLMVACGIEPLFYVTNVLCTKPVGFGRAYYADHNNDKGLAIMWAVFLCAVEIGRSL